MKHKQLHILFAWLSAALLLAGACMETGLEGPRPEQEAGIVSVRLQIQNQGVLTKADGTASEKALPHISDGTKVDQLILAVYSSNSKDGLYTISKHEGKVTVQREENDWKSTWNNDHQMTLTFDNNPGAFTGQENGLTLKIRVEGGKYYKLVCWAQSSICEAFDTKDLTQVYVDYSKVKNNDELCDAFCKASAPFNSATPLLTVVLRRPFAQINVGTAGWDYEGAAILKPGPVTYTESAITLSGVAQCYDVLNETAVVNKEIEAQKLTNVTFDYATIPAFYNVKLEDGETYKYTPYIEEENEENRVIEEFLKIRNSNPYVGWDDYKSWSIKEQNGTLDGSDANPFTTETFKYLSMCYVLVPETSSNNGATLDVSFMIRGKINIDNTSDTNDGTNGDGNGYTNFGKTGEVFTLSNVPVQKNWRTNIVGYDFFTTRSEFKLWVVPDYCGDHSRDIYEDDEWQNDEFGGFRDPGKDYKSGESQTKDPEDQQ